MSVGGNPYAPGSTTGALLPGQLRLANPGTRILGFLIDCAAGFVFAVPGMVLSVIGAVVSGDNGPGLIGVAGFLLYMLGGLLALIVQLYLLATRSQTIGKVIMKTQIVDAASGRRADFVHAVLLRMLVHALIGFIPCVNVVYVIIDVVYLFKEDRRTLHDHLASTAVVEIS